MSSPIIEIVVGPASESYSVDRSVLCSQSDYFTAACSERWLAEDGTIRLPEEDPVIFELLLKFLHKKSYPSVLGKKMVGVVRPQFVLYVLADKYRVPKLVEGLNFWFSETLYSPRNYAYSFANYVSDCEIRFVYENTPPSSVLRRMVARSVVHEIAKKLIDLTIPGQGILQLCIELPDFAHDLVAEMPK